MTPGLDRTNPCRRPVRRVGLLAAALLLAGVAGCQTGGGPGQPGPITVGADCLWPRPIVRHGLGNFRRVSYDLYRGAQPDEEGLEQLRLLGVATVIDLRGRGGDDSDSLRRRGLEHVRIPCRPWAPNDDDVVRFLKTVVAPGRPPRGPFFVHCRHGADRTGLMVAMYRIAIQGWSKDDAIDEMTGGDYGFHGIWGNLVRYIRNADVERLRRKAGLA